MVELYLLDTNPVIDFFNGKLPEKGKKLISEIEPVISVITYIVIIPYRKKKKRNYQIL